MDRVARVGAAPAAAPLLPRTIWYMGAKSRLIEGSEELQAGLLPGPLCMAIEDLLPRGGTVFDLFSGTGIVSVFAARRHRVLANDVQRYAYLIARAFIERPPGGGGRFAASLDIDRDLLPAFEENRARLGDLYRDALAEEARLLEAYATAPRGPGAQNVAARYRAFLGRPGGLYGGGGSGPVGNGAPDGTRGGLHPSFCRAAELLSERSLARYRKDPMLLPSCLLTAYHANVYYGLRQAIDLDSLRAAIDGLSGGDPLTVSGSLTERKGVHYLSALLHAASISTSGTSHFAQPRQLTKDSELSAMARRRRIDVLAAFRDASAELARHLAATDLDSGNRCFCSDYRQLLEGEGSRETWSPEARAELVYMDPPYTQDNYSRFYHVLESLASYDYPELERDARGQPLAGRYPRGRFQSGFCRPGGVEGEFRRVIAASARSGAGLIISYAAPNGLLLKVYGRRGTRDPVAALATLCRGSYRSVEVIRVPLFHSGQGDKNIASEELLCLCRGPR